MKSRPTSRLSIIGLHEINLRERKIGYTLKQSCRIRGIRLEIHDNSGLIVIVPKGFNQQQVTDILVKKTQWILRHIPVQRPVQMPLFRKEIDHGEKLPFLGNTIELVLNNNDSQVPGTAILKGRKLFVTPAENVSQAQILEKWYRAQAARVFREKADRFKTIMGIHCNLIIIRGQRKRWGSASHSGNISINWKLLLAPEEIVDYVILHELAHLKHMNHSRKFWDYLSRYCPHWRKCRQWLVTHETDLNASAMFAR